MVKRRDTTKTVDPQIVAKTRLSAERGTVIKDHVGKLSVALVYPNVYEVGMSNLGFQKIYHLLNLRADVVCERAFLSSREEARFSGKRKQKICSLETGKPLSEFDVVAFSVTFEPDYLNVLSILSLAGIPLKGRGKRDPLVVAGGVAVTLNPEPVADFIDVVLLGEGEKIIDPFVSAIIKNGKGDLKMFASLPGAYVPSAYTPVYAKDGTLNEIKTAGGFPQKVKREWDEKYGEEPNRTYVETEKTVFGDMALVETGKGCGKHCRFCAAGYIYRPTRHAQTEPLLSAIDDGLLAKGKVGLVGSAICDHPEIEKIFAHIISRGGKFSVSSLRLDNLTNSMLENLLKGECKTITVAPEAGTETLRRRVNKNLPDDMILDTAKRISEAGPFSLKMYFIVGLPGETEDDVNSIIDLTARVRAIMEPAWKKRGHDEVITVGVSGFVPKPCTPYEREPFIGIKKVAEKLNRVARGLRGIPRVAYHPESARQAYLQALLSAGDRRVGALLEKALELDGDWFRAIRETEIDANFYVSRRKGENEILPWDFIDHGFRAGYLEKELKKSETGKLTPECPPPDETCERCGEFLGICIEKNK